MNRQVTPSLILEKYELTDAHRLKEAEKWISKIQALHFEDFKNWLEDSAYTIKKKKALISYSTKNHCIKTLNTFLDSI